MPEIRKICQWEKKFYCERPNLGAEERPKITPSEGEKAREYLFDDESAAYNKLQEISSVCGLRMNNIQVVSHYVRIQCPFCAYISELKPGKHNGMVLKNLKK